jgi:hypothetical protein
MPHDTSRLEAIATIGIDIGKNTFHLVGLDRNGAIVLRQKLSRRPQPHRGLASRRGRIPRRAWCPERSQYRSIHVRMPVLSG